MRHTLSPNDLAIGLGFSFDNGTIYEKLSDSGMNWRIYHDSLPQSFGIISLRPEYINIFTKRYREMRFFDKDVKDESLPEYTFIEPCYDWGNNYQGGNSMHPLNDIRKGERLVKQVYETLRKSSYWNNTMLIIIFDEHGGFYDHVSPPAAVPSGDDTRYASNEFAFDRLGVRVPAIAISAFTQRGTVIGNDPGGSPIVFDHTSVLATVEKRFGLKPLTKRDAAARTLEVTLNLKDPRILPADAPMTLPKPAKDTLLKSVRNLFAKAPEPGSSKAPLSNNQKSFLALALACDKLVSDPSKHEAMKTRHDAINSQKEAARYMQEVDNKIHERRKAVQVTR